MGASINKKRNFFLLVICSFFLLLCIGGGSLLVYNFYENKKKDSKYCIRSLIQTGPEKEALPTRYLCELLDLSINEAQNLYAYDSKKAEEKLLLSPVIKTAKLKKIYPDTLHIDYTVRYPIAEIYDWKNFLVDNEGYIFPALPFFSCKNLPAIYLGLEHSNDIAWSQPLQNKEMKLAMTILYYLSQMQKTIPFHVQRIDVSEAFSSSYGKREIVVMLEHEYTIKKEAKKILCLFPHIVRLPFQDYLKQLGNYISLYNKMIDDYSHQMQQRPLTETFLHFETRVIDMRVDNLAFIDQS